MSHEEDHAIEKLFYTRLHHIERQNELILINQEIQMATTQELADSIAALAVDVQALVDAHAGGVQPADLDPLVASVNDLDAQVKAAVPPA